ncbi:MAG TPA: choice-of-anchor Q domain-containing protein [Solirubrobacterales bacterium]|nr:choice-of-anchor Q domain-containing protein [Solirubrobacterales bacterium]
MKPGRAWIAALATVAAVGLCAGEARATTFCVPSFTVACPNANGNVVVVDLEEAMSLNGFDGVADQVFIAGGTYTEDADYEPPGGSVGTFQATGADPLTITGAGIGVTHLTSSATGNIFLVNLGLNGNVRDIVIRDLDLQVPASFDDNAGAALQLFHGDTAERIAIESLNNGSDGVVAVDPGNEIRDSEIFGQIGGLVATALSTGSEEAELLVEDVATFGASRALAANGINSTLTARRLEAFGTRTYGASAGAGTVRIENSLLNMEDGVGLFVSPAADDAAIEADHVTAFNSSGSVPALEAKKFSVTAGKGTLKVSNSIFRGFGSGYKIERPVGSGALSVEARYSNIPSTGTNENGTVNFGTGNIDADPLWNGAYQLPPESPSIDAGDPAPGGLAVDFLGAPRPNDGNGDGLAVRDQGMFEYQRPATSGGGGGDKDPEPKVIVDPLANTFITAGPGKKLSQGKARFSFKSDLRNPRFQCQLDKRKVRPCTSPKLYKRLKPGRHVFKVWAIAGFGKDPTPAKKRFRVPA